jgi:hypothetical protein
MIPEGFTTNKSRFPAGVSSLKPENPIATERVPVVPAALEKSGKKCRAG